MKSAEKGVPVQAFGRAGVQETDAEKDEKDESQIQTL